MMTCVPFQVCIIMKAWNGLFCLKRGKKKKKNSYVIKLSVKSPSLSPPIPSFSGIRKVRKSAPSGGAQEKRKEGMKPSLPPKIWWKKTSLGPSYFVLLKVSFSVTHLMPYYAKTSCSRPLINCLTLQITLTLIFK